MIRRAQAWVRRRRAGVLIVWAIALMAATPFAMRQQDQLTTGGFGVPGSESEAVERSVPRDFPDEVPERLGAVVAVDSGAPRSVSAAGLAFVRDAARAEGVGIAQPPYAHGRAGGRELMLVPLTFRKTFSQTVDLATRLTDRLEAPPPGGGSFETYLTGRPAQLAALQNASEEGLVNAEVIGFPIVLLVLLAVFGSLAAAALPLALAVASVTATGAAIYFIAQATEMSIFAANVASMIGIGVGVDYALFMLVRYREEVRRGASFERAEATMIRTSGRAVVFSGATVAVALASLLALNNPAIRSMALGAIVVVAASVLAAMSLLPVLIRILGRRVTRPGRLQLALGRLRARGPASRRSTDDPTFWLRWTRTVMARPWLSVGVALAILGALSLPVLAIDVGNDTLRQLPRDGAAREGARLAAAIEGPGAQAPVLVRLRFRDAAQASETARTARLLGRALRRDPEVAGVRTERSGVDRRTLLVAAAPRHQPEDRRVESLVRRVRDEVVPAVRQGSAVIAEAHVGGSPAGTVDLLELVTGRIWLVLGLLLALSYAVLLVLLRSVFLPLKAIVLNMISVAAAYGVLVVVFQWLGLGEMDRIGVVALPLILVVVFGLSMDYEVFLLTRIRERYEATGDNATAVAEGIASSARAVTSAALIMVAVFLVFTFTNVPVLQQIGLGNAVAIGIDATLTRLVLLPAAMVLMGRWNWWLPSGLQRLFSTEPDSGARAYLTPSTPPDPQVVGATMDRPLERGSAR